MRIVSLVPSLTEAVASVDRSLLVGATDYCAYPADLDVVRVGGSKYPTVATVLGLRPDLVLANVEENQRADVQALRAAGVRVWVCYPRTLDEAFGALREMFELIRVAEPAWLAEAERTWAAPPDRVLAERALVPVWRKPWVVLGSGTFAGDVLARVGVRHAYHRAPDRYPRPSLDELRATRPDLLVLPDEPYPFNADDGPQFFPEVPYALVSGRHLTWYGPSLRDARQVLAEALIRA